MKQTVTPAEKPFPKWILPYSVSVTILHTAVFISWFVLYNAMPELAQTERLALYNEFWIIPSLIGARWFSGILLLLSLSVVIIAGRMVDQGRMRLAIIVLVLNLCFLLMSGWGLF